MSVRPSADLVNVGTEFVPAGVPAETADVLIADVPVNVGAVTEPAGVPVFAPPVPSRVPKSGSPELNETGIRPAPNATHVPNPRSVEGFVATADMKIEPTGQQAETLPACPAFPCGPCGPVDPVVP